MDAKQENGTPEWINNIGAEVYQLIRQHDAMPRFREMANKWIAFREAERAKIREWEARRQRYFENKVARDPRLRNQEAGPPEPDWAWDYERVLQRTENGSGSTTIRLYGWVPPEFVLESQPGLEEVLPLSRELNLAEQYAWLLAFYEDNRKGTKPAELGIWLKDAEGLEIFQTLIDEVRKLTPNHEPWLKGHLEDVKKDLGIRETRVKDENRVDYVFKWTGDYWTVAFGGNPKTIIHMKGMACIAALLAEPGKSFDPAILWAAGTDWAKAAPILTVSPQQMTDSEARQDYKEEKEGLQRELAEAKKDNDLARISQIQRDLDAIEQDASRTKRLGGGIRQFHYEGQKPREATAKAIRRAIKRVAKHHNQLWLHLHNCIDIPNLRYIPDTEIDWDL